jgi:hypothetical protein
MPPCLTCAGADDACCRTRPPEGAATGGSYGQKPQSRLSPGGLQTVILSIPALPAVPAARVIREAAEAYTRILCCELQNGMILPGLQFATSLKSTNHR